MAVAAAPYIHARLAAIQTKVETVGQIEAKITFEERRRQAVEAVRAAFAERPREIEHVAEKAQEIEQRSNVPDAETAAEPMPSPFRGWLPNRRRAETHDLATPGRHQSEQVADFSPE